jgi:hypothetical protein
VLDRLRVAVIRETFRKSSDDSRPFFYFPQQQNPRVGGDIPSVKFCDHFSLKKSVKFKRSLVTLCRHKGRSSLGSKRFSSKLFCQLERPFLVLSVKFTG